MTILYIILGSHLALLLIAIIYLWLRWHRLFRDTRGYNDDDIIYRA